MRSCSATRDLRRDNGSRSVRGRQSANPRITGGLVSPEQANAPAPAPSASGTCPRAANGQQSVSLGLLAGDLAALASHVGKLTWRRPTSVGDERGGSSRRVPNAGAPGLAATRPRQPRSQDFCNQTPSSAAWVPRQPCMASRSPPVIDAACAAVSQAASGDDRIARTIVAAGSLAWSGRPQGTLG